MARILFWNVNNNDLTHIVCALAESTEAEVVILNENSVPYDTTLNALRSDVASEYYAPISISKKRFHCFCRDRLLDMQEIHTGFRTSVRNLRIGSSIVLLALVHGLDLRNYDSETRQSFAQSVSNDMRFVKQQKGTNRLLLMGDFNMNPYERGMNLAAGLNAMMTRTCVSAGTRTHLNEDYDLYYNPMWSLFGDNTDGPPGTVYDTSSQGTYGWSMFDQVVLNHSSVGMFGDVEILTQAGQYCLMDRRGRPDKKNASDHFPILLTLNEDNYE